MISKVEVTKTKRSAALFAETRNLEEVNESLYKIKNRWQNYNKFIDHLLGKDLLALARAAKTANLNKVRKIFDTVANAKAHYVDTNAYKKLSAMKSLNCCEDELVACIHGADLLDTLSEKAIDAGLIPNEVKDDLDNVDGSILYELKCRYFLNCLLQKIANYYDLYESWLDLLSQHGETHVVLGHIRQQRDRFMKGLVSCGDDGISEEEVVVGMEHHVLEICFEEKHVSALTKVLAAHSSKWSDIGISLGLPKDAIDNLMPLFLSGDSDACLFRVIYGWVTKEYNQAKPPTFETLQNALCSETVSLGVEADNLQENLTKQGILPSVSRSSDVQAQKIFSQSHDVEITEGKHVLLEVRVRGMFEADYVYQWYKDGEILLGSKENILCILVSSLVVEGSYMCEIQQVDGCENSFQIL